MLLKGEPPPAQMEPTTSMDHIILVLALAMLVAMLQSMSTYFSLVVMTVLAVGWRLAAQSHSRSSSASRPCTPHPDMSSNLPPDQESASRMTGIPVNDDVCRGLDTLMVLDECSSTNRSIAINSTIPVPIENKFFQGHVLFLVRTARPNSTWEHLFAGRRRNFWIQVQGKFKCPPRGSIFMGGELPHPVSVGFLARSLARVVAGIMRRFLGTTHVGFGDHIERPHCVFPLYQTVDEMVVTSHGAAPPTLGQVHFGESPVARQRRRLTPLGTESFHVNSTYTFQFHTMYVDLAKWTIVNVPGMQDVHLTTFFKQVPLHLTCYDVEPTPKHDHASKQYLFCFSVHWTPPSTTTGLPIPSSAARPQSPTTLVPQPTSMRSPSNTRSRPPAATTTRSTPAALCIPYWLERLDHTKTRIVVYLARDLPSDTLASMARQLHELPAKMLRSHFSQLSNLNAKSKLARYNVIDANRLLVQASDVDANVVARLAEPFAWVPASASSLGVKLHQLDGQPTGGVVLQQQVVRAISDSHLRQEYMVLTHTALHFFRTYSSAPCASIPLEHIVAVSQWTLPHGEGPAFNHGIHVHTTRGHAYLCLPTASAQTEWLRGIATYHERRQVDSYVPMRSPWNDLVPASRPGILNTFRLFRPFTPEPALPQASPAHATLPMALMDCIETSFAAIEAANVVEATTTGGRDYEAQLQSVVAFLETVASLQWVDPSTLTSPDDRVAFYLNVHSVLAWHMRQIDTMGHSTKLPHGCTACYRIGSDQVMTLPAMQAAALRFRHANATDTTLQVPADFRVRLALHMTTSTLPRFDPRRVQYQLNALCTRFLRETVSTDVPRHSIQLPRRCREFRFDFGPNGTGIECARKVLGFLHDSCAADMQTILLAHDEAPVDVQYVDDGHVVVEGALPIES
ncbi:hypothetical protein H310_12274 [Aphanomyces invadans]|uniref:Domain of unknown function at the cortex 1 domain-containing protein n=1 Tax=Aphanomyces invadans TaxID=157072 RepID=A0A024TKU8_9STRA|nr:hypothetical protein H310_12274 [Aphanomyces invadans]ETV93937.1 hypothetical protein H310_12274 [Aphanomyces invadans]|eukprot:XP_008877497.1 hypothetical protein H310_12274 [Aphanomyces invadans]